MTPTLHAAAWAICKMHGQKCKRLCTMCLEISDVAGRVWLRAAAKKARSFPAHSHGSLATTPQKAAEQAASEIAAAIEAMIGENPEP